MTEAIARFHALVEREAAPSPVFTDRLVLVEAPFVAELFSAESRRLVGALTWFVGDASEAEDLAQEAFACFHAARPRLRDPDRAVSYLYSVAFNLARSRWRRQASLGRALLRLGPSADVGGEDVRAADEAGMVHSTMAAVTALPERQRACVLLHYYSELTVAETAAALGISANSVKTHLARALCALRTSLAGEERS